MPNPDLDWLNELNRWGRGRAGQQSLEHARIVGDAWTSGSFRVDPEAATSVLRLMSRHPARTPAQFERLSLMDVGQLLDGDLVRVRDEGLAILGLGAQALVAAGGADDRLIRPILAVAFGLDVPSTVLRRVILDGTYLPELPRPPRVPTVDPKDIIRKAIIWGTLYEGLLGWGLNAADVEAYNAWVDRAKAHADGIRGLSPNAGCAGIDVKLTGVFPAVQPPFTFVVMSTGGSCTKATDVRWGAAGEIVVKAPTGVGIGPVGFLVTDGDPPAMRGTVGDPSQAAAAMQTAFGMMWGPSGIGMGQKFVQLALTAGPQLKPWPCPPLIRSRHWSMPSPNLFIGGPPVVRSFTAGGVEPGGKLTLSWNVAGHGVQVSIKPLAGASAWAKLPNALPPVPGQFPGIGSVDVVIPYDGVDDWDAEYELSAVNPCSTYPVTARARVEMRESTPLLFGFADTHVHFVSHLAFGGYGVSGLPWPTDHKLPAEKGLEQALPWCGHELIGLEAGFPPHDQGGYPQFDGWPKHTSLAHQQAYVDWIKRAYDGGLRLVVCLAVNNELLGARMTELFGDRLPIDDMSAIDRQLQAMRDMVAWIDEECGGPGQGWMQIAETPADARRIVGADKLAMVMGVEVDSLGWKTEQALTDDATAQGKGEAELIKALVDDLYAKGVRHVFPVHAANNAFGGAALFVRAYDAVNYYLTGRSFDTATAPADSGITYRIDQDTFPGDFVGEVLFYHGTSHIKTGALAGAALGGILGGTHTAGASIPIGALIGGAAAVAQLKCPPQPTNWAATAGGHINAMPLTTPGRVLVQELMRNGMIIDIDHMGHKTTDDVFAMVEPAGYPVVSGHTSFRELKHKWLPNTAAKPFNRNDPAVTNAYTTKDAKRLAHEADKSPRQIERLRRLGGFLSVFSQQRDAADCGCGKVFNNSAGSSKSLAQGFLYARKQMHHRRVGIGTDANGAGEFVGPRFGPNASVSIKEESEFGPRRAAAKLPSRAKQVFEQDLGVRYQGAIRDYRAHRFTDYNDGTNDAPFDGEQRDFWEAIAMFKAGATSGDAEQPFLRAPGTKWFIANLLTGLIASGRAALPLPVGGVLEPEWFDVQLAALLASTGGTPAAGDPQRTKDLVPKLTPVWNHWVAMEGDASAPLDPLVKEKFGPKGSGLYDDQGRLSRSTAGRRDFDLNLDGMAHYGLFPDLIQDMRNVGVTAEELATLYRSAEDYIRTWERCEARKPPRP